MKQYDSYKDSGIEWIGEVPEHWDVIKTSIIYDNIGSGTTPSSSNSMYYTEGTDGFFWLQTGDLNDGQIWNTSKKVTKLAVKECKLKFYPVNSVVIAMYGATIGKVGLLKIETSTNQACCVLPKSKKMKELFSFYLYQAAKQPMILEAIGGGQPNISQDIIKRLKVPVPPLSEQQQIVNYIVKQMGNLDKAIAQQQRMIDLLNERKQIIIQQAVTKGLNPNAKMKDSGQQWLGKIPSHWGCRPIKQFKSKCKNAFVDGPFGSNLKSEHFIDNGEVFVVESGTITSGVFKHSKLTKTISLKHFQTICRSECKEDDVIIAKIGANYGMAGILPNLSKRAVVSGNSLKITLDHTKIENQYFVYLMQVAKMMGGFKDMVSETAQPALSLGGLNNMYFPLPNLDEQKNILEYIDTNICPMQAIIQNCEKLIERLKERKQIIINEAVTGKIKVI